MKTYYKISLSIILILILTFLTSCKSWDYDKANELFDDKKYEEALDLYEELEDYEDSESKAIDCKYKMLIEYIQKSGSDHNGLKSIKTSSNDGVTSEYRECYLCISNNDSLTIEIEQQPYYMRLDYVYTLSFTINQKLPTTFNASQQFNFENASTNIKASGTINVSELTTNSKLTFQSYLSTTKDIYGKIKTSSTDENNSFEKTVNKLLEQAISDTRKILSDTGIGITMADIGFKKLY